MDDFVDNTQRHPPLGAELQTALQKVIERSVIVSEGKSFSVDESWLSRQPLRKLPTSGKGLPQRRNKRLRQRSPNPADEFSVLRAQLQSLVLRDPLWSRKLER
jgi:hypothetical protein